MLNGLDFCMAYVATLKGSGPLPGSLGQMVWTGTPAARLIATVRFSVEGGACIIYIL